MDEDQNKLQHLHLGQIPAVELSGGRAWLDSNLTFSTRDISVCEDREQPGGNRDTS